MPATCKNCKRKKATRPRGLCWTCYNDRTVRGNYEKLGLGKYNEVGSGVNMNISRGLPKPTQCLPGSPGKVEVLVERARLGMELFHPLDARCHD